MNSPLMNKFFIFILLLVGVLFLARISFILLGLLMPFVIGFIIAIIANPLKKRLQDMGVPRAIAALISILVIVAVLFIFLYLLFNLAKTGILSIEKYSDQIIETVTSNFKQSYINIQSHYPKLLTKDYQSFIEDLRDGGILSLKGLNFGTTIFSVARSLPSSIIFIIFTLMSSYYFCLDFNKIKEFIKVRLQASHLADKLAGDFRESIKLGLGSWLKAQIVIMSVSFVLSAIFFTLFKIPYGILLALGLALFDALPLFGAGAVLWPLSLYYILVQNYLLGILSLVLYIIIVTTRQIIEPKLIGQQIGINPIITLLTVYLGFKLLGVTGIILGVIILVIATSIINGKAFSGFNKISEEE